MANPIALVCVSCSASFERIGTRGPIPRFCLDCRAERQRAALRKSARQRRDRDPEGERAKARAYRKANPEKVRRLDRDRHERDRAKRNAAARAWYDKNVDRARELARLSLLRQREVNLEGYRAKRAAIAQRRRAAIRGAEVERFEHSEVFERDGWICQLCGDPTDWTTHFPDPLSPSLDHIVPLSRGGEHSRANTQCAHLACNIRKGNRA